jgi:acyl-CoA hydrolase
MEASDPIMNFHTRKWVKPEDLNPNGTLFGGSLLKWIDEEAAIYAIVQLDNHRVVTKFMSEINFVSSARQGDIIELGIEPRILAPHLLHSIVLFVIKLTGKLFLKLRKLFLST